MLVSLSSFETCRTKEPTSHIIKIVDVQQDLGETCLHAEALVFAVMFGVRIHNDTPHTWIPCRCLYPKQVKSPALNCHLLIWHLPKCRLIFFFLSFFLCCFNQVYINTDREVTLWKPRSFVDTHKPTEDELAVFLDKLKHAHRRKYAFSISKAFKSFLSDS